MTNRIHILLVEDTPSDIRLTKEALKDSGIEHELAVVNDGEQAMDFLRENADSPSKPDLLLLDLNMPKKNGHEVLQEMKQLQQYRDTPVILLTVSRDEEDIAKALSLKMNYYLSKPVTNDKLDPLLRAMQELGSETGSKLATAEDVHVRYILAGNPHTAASTLQKLAGEQNATIRMRVAENANTPLDTLASLVEDPCPEVRAALADNASASIQILEKLAKDKNEDVRLAVALNPRVPIKILRDLSVDTNGYVMSAAQKTLDALGAHPKF